MVEAESPPASGIHVQDHAHRKIAAATDAYCMRWRTCLAATLTCNWDTYIPVKNFD